MAEQEPVVDPSWSDTPEPNEHARFKDIYEIVDNNTAVGYCIISALNDVIFLNDFTLTNYTSNTTFGTLNSNCIPDTQAYIPVIVNDGTNIINTYLIISTSGEIALPDSYSSVTIYTKRLSFNNCANYFDPS